MDKGNTKQKVIISYSGSRNAPLEDKLRTLAEKHGGAKSGEWGYSDQSFQCLFLFRRLMNVDMFRQEAQRTLDTRITIVYG